MAVTRPAEADAAEGVGRRWTSLEGMPDVTELGVACEHLAGAVVLRCAGSVDGSNAEELRTAVESTVSAVVIVELGELDRFDPAGMKALEEAFRGPRSNHRSFFVVAPPGSAAERTYRTAARGRQRLVPTVDAALQQHG